MMLLTLLAAAVAWAPQAGPARTGTLLFEDDFDRAEPAPKWKVGKGFFDVAGGVMTARENPDDRHGAYATAGPSFPFKNLVVEYSAKLVGGRACHLMVDDTRYKESHAGHILRATLMPGRVELADQKFGRMKKEIYDTLEDPKVPEAEKKKIREGIKDKTAGFKVDADFGEWRKVRVEIVGDEMTLSIDGRPAGYLKSAGLDHATKNGVGFTVLGQSTLLKSVRMWEASPAPDWPARREAFLGALKNQNR